MASGTCPRCDKKATIFECDECGDTRCNSSAAGGVSGSENEGCAAAGEGAHLNHSCQECRRGKYRAT